MIYIVVASFFAADIFLTTLSIAGCGADQCDYTLQSNTVNVFLLFDAVVLLAVVALGLIRLRRGQSTWWLPAGGIVLVLIGAVIAHQVSHIALPVP
ncbi:hypothetical protein ACFC14_08445 [Microbacterium sp. NPDC055988]|uniref:hypothetical protein n=1 Tax=Microbacterium sp. NPDC055988 TaxID=3345671 RepID=UPI0035DB6D9F